MALNTDPQPEPNLDIYDFESQIGEAVIAEFDERAAAKAHTERSEAILKTPRIEVIFITGQQVQRTCRPSGTTWNYPDLWLGKLLIAVVTNRTDAAQKDQSHQHNRSIVRRMMQTTDKINQRLKWLEIVQSLGAGDNALMVDENNCEDKTVMTFDVKIALKPSAFPKPD